MNTTKMNPSANIQLTGMKLRSGKFVSANNNNTVKSKKNKNKAVPHTFQDIVICALIINIVGCICFSIIGYGIAFVILDAIPYCKIILQNIENTETFEIIIKNVHAQLMNNTSCFGVNIENLNMTSF